MRASASSSLSLGGRLLVLHLISAGLVVILTHGLLRVWPKGTIRAVFAGVVFGGVFSFVTRRVLLEPLDDLGADLERAATKPDPFHFLHLSRDAVTAPLVEGIHTLVSRLRESEAALRAARAAAERDQACLRFMLESMPVGITSAILEEDGRLTRYVNEFQERITGLPRGEYDQPSAYLHLTHPDDAAREAELHERLRSGETDRISLEKRLVLPDGRTIWVVSTFQRQDYADGTLQELATLVDITELKHSQEQSVREQARLRFILESIPVGISSAILEADGQLLHYVNQAQERITGLPRAQHRQAANFHLLTHPEDAPREDALRERLRRREISRLSLEKRIVRPDGSLVWVVSTFQRQDHADGSLEELATLMDITELRRAQEQSQREQARLQFILRAMPVGVFSTILGEDGRLTRYVNAAQQRITGLSREQYANQETFHHLTHPEDAPREADLQERFRRGEIDRVSLEKRLVRPDGSIVWVVSTFQRQDYADGTLEELVTLIDITDLREAQERSLREQARFRFIFDSLPVGVDWSLVDDPASRIVNPAHARISGVATAFATDPAREWAATHPDDRVRQQGLEARLLAGEIEQYTMEKRFTRPDGSYAWGEVHLRCHADPVTGRIQRIGTLADLDERKHAQAEIEHVHRQLLETSRKAGMAEVATEVLHNVGNVLNSVNISYTVVADKIRRSKALNIGKLHSLLEPHSQDLAAFLTDDPKGRMVLPYIKTLAAGITEEQKDLLQELEHLRGSIEHIKEIVHMQQAYAKTSGITETISMPDLIEDAIRLNAGSFARHDVDVAREYRARPVITVEKNKVLQILVNLLRNAKYACDESGRTDKLITVQVTAEGDRVRVAVVDNGVGIPPENLTRIFAHGFTTRKTGHGFGLHSGALAARDLGGSLLAFSEGPGHGSRFELTLPLAAPAHASAQDLPSSPPNPNVWPRVNAPFPPSSP